MRKARFPLTFEPAADLAGDAGDPDDADDADGSHDGGDEGGPAQGPDRPSKTALKRQAHDLQDLGEQLAALPTERLDGLDMSSALRDALAQLQRTRSHEGRRRQRQYVGKLMRQQDVEPLRQAVAQSRLGSARDALALHKAEAWRHQLAADDAALTRFMAEHPDCDVQQLRQLIRMARRDAALQPEQRHGRAWRELFQFIKPHVS